MVFCNACARDVPGNRDADGLLSCGRCGKVLKFDNFSTEATFVKNASGMSQLSGKLIRSIESENLSRERLYQKAREDLTNIKNGLGMGESHAMVDEAMKYYRIAVERNFTKGRRTEQVQAACLYIACRENSKPYLLIDFSNFLQINIYVLGSVFLQLCQVLNLTEHPICQRLLDPSIFIHKYTACLAGGKNRAVSYYALNIIASMNRDWLQTGRRPSGLWGAALYISVLTHGIKCSKSDILRLVHVCEDTLSKRLVEFENTESGSLTIDELNAKAEELKESSIEQSKFGLQASSSKELLCQHKHDRRLESVDYGLCRDCFAYFIGYEGGSDPPAFQLAEKQRKEKESTTDKATDSNLLEKELSSEDVCRGGISESVEPHNVGSNTGHAAVNDVGGDKKHEADDMSPKNHNESDNFSDIDDDEVDGYIHNEEETCRKKMVWEKMNRDYIEEQEAKEKEAAAKRAWEANINDSEGMQDAMKLAADVAKAKKERQRKRAAEAKSSTPAQTAAEAAGQMLKRVSTKINYDALEKLFDEPGVASAKKTRSLSNDEHDDKLQHTENKDLENTNNKKEDLVEDENGDEMEDGGYNEDIYDENGFDTYNYDDEIGYDYDGF